MKTLKKILVSKLIKNYTKQINKMKNDTNKSESDDIFKAKLRSNVSKTNKIIKVSRDKDENHLIMKVPVTENITSNQLELFRKMKILWNQLRNLCWNTKIIAKMNQ